MSNTREDMNASLKALVVPALRVAGFKGSFPHLRRQTGNGIDLMTFQFDRDGGGFVIEIARSPLHGLTTAWGKKIEPSKVTAWDLHPDKRFRVKPGDGSGADSWFRYDENGAERCASQVLDLLPVAEGWFMAAANSDA